MTKSRSAGIMGPSTGIKTPVQRLYIFVLKYKTAIHTSRTDNAVTINMSGIRTVTLKPKEEPK